MKTALKDDEAVRIMRMSEVLKVTGYSRASIYAQMRAGQFPKNVKLGKRAVGWSSLEVQGWVEEKLAAGGVVDG